MSRSALRVVLTAAVVVLLLSVGASQRASSQGLTGSDDDPAAVPSVYVPEPFQAAGGAEPAATSGEVLLWFTPEDGNYSATVLYLYNTADAAATVNVEGYSSTGGLMLNSALSIPARNLVRICSDSVIAAVPPLPLSWSSPVLWNFTDNVTYASLSMPPTVHVQGYVAWTNAASFDPNGMSPKVSLRLSADPLSLFLPSVTR
ncbi:MAG: hypothetical protein R6X16_17135 [Anaerolineae bacterium]